jgi:hypothetical protein
MGLLNFWKNKASDQSAVSPKENQQLISDLPAIDGDSINNSVDGSSMQSYGNINQLPSIDAPSQTDNKSISFNVPTFDFSMPASEDTPAGRPSALQQPVAPISSVNPVTSPNLSLDEDLNHLFINDDSWKEPDWNSFDPYPEEKIDEPTIEDFKGADLPKFEERSNNPLISSESVSEPAPFREAPKTDRKPVELFIRGRAYNRVFIELDQMNKTLDAIDSQIDTYEEMLKREEPLLNVAKDQMEYLYKRLNQVDKKIFIQ